MMIQKKLVLGTVQLGLDYGINNEYGKPKEEDAFEILNFAYDSGVDILDTASSYGDSEKIIGEFTKRTGKKFKIATKFILSDDKKSIEKEIDKSLNNLNIHQIDYYYYHSYSNFRENIEVLDILELYKKKHIINKIGISLYEPKELEEIINNKNKSIDVVQIPFNILDKRWLEDNLLGRTKERGIEIFTRSIYLQGLFFASKRKINKVNPLAEEYIKTIKMMAKKYGIEYKKVFMKYVINQKDIDYVLVGCEKINQLKEDIEIFNEENIYENFFYEINKEITGVPEEIIDVRKWKR